MFARKRKKAQESKVKKTYAGIGRVAYATATPFLKLYLHEKHMRVRVLITNDDQEVLLVRSWFGHQKWTLPGGGIRSVEKPAEAAVREVFEETGLRIALDHLHELGTFTNPIASAPYMVACFQVSIPKRPPRIAHHRRLEMLDVSWFPLSHLPRERSPLVDMALTLLK